MISKITNYLTLVFDCDGVILNSNSVKTNAFYKAALPYGQAAAQALVHHHTTNGGISRYLKFEYFLNNIVPKLASNITGPNLHELLKAYAENVINGLLTCDIAPGLHSLRDRTPNTRWLIVSGGDQNELQEIFEKRNLSGLFDGGIYGSPDTKETILTRELKNGNITQPALFLGDSQYDYKAANSAKLDFVFLSNWTEVTNWENWCNTLNIQNIASLQELLNEDN